MTSTPTTIDGGSAAVWPPADRAFYATVMQQGPLSSSTMLMGRNSLVHATRLAGRPTEPGATLGEPAPDFSIVAADGSTRTLADFRGRPLVLALYRALDPVMICPFCKRGMDELKKTFAEFAAAGVELAVVYPTTPDGVQAIQAAHDLQWPAYSDPGWDVFSAYASDHILWGPYQMYAIIDADGVVRWLWRREPTETDVAGVMNTPFPSEVLAAARELFGP